MDVLADRILIYGLGDEGYGCVFYKEDFRQYERASGGEKGQKSIAKTFLSSNFKEDGFVVKTGGYTTANDKKRTQCTIASLREKETDSGQFAAFGTKDRSCHILGEIDEDLWLTYSYVDHSFTTWNTGTN